jgi:hypothetical protein
LGRWVTRRGRCCASVLHGVSGICERIRGGKTDSHNDSTLSLACANVVEGEGPIRADTGEDGRFSHVEPNTVDCFAGCGIR